MFPLLPVAIIGLIGGAAWKKHKGKKELPDQKKLILHGALNGKLAPEKLTSLAESFDKEGYKAEAELLRQRAKLANASPAEKTAWRDAFRKAMASEKPEAVAAMAKAFRDMGAIGAADQLSHYSRGLKDGTAAPVPLKSPLANAAAASAAAPPAHPVEDHHEYAPPAEEHSAEVVEEHVTKTVIGPIGEPPIVATAPTEPPKS